MNSYKKYYKKVICFLFIFLFLFIASLFIYKYYNSKDDYININSLSKKFINTYLDNNQKITEESKENILIITTKEKNLEKYGASNIIEAPNNQYYLQYENRYDKEKALNKLKNDNVIVSENIVHTIDEDTVLVSSYNSWGVEAMGMDTLREKLQNKELNDVVVAIIDTGLNVDLFNENYPNRLAGMYSIVASDKAMVDEVGHGTHIAGTIAESTPDNVKIFPVKVSTTKNIYETDIVAAINYVTHNRVANVMNMSFGSYAYSTNEYNAIEAARKNNIISVAAAGNDNVSRLDYPASFDNTISVASLTSTFEKSDFSNFGDSIMFSAPGSDIVSINGTMSGTSMATPHVVSAVSYLQAMNNNLSYEDIILLLRRYSDDLGDIGWDEIFGYGFINFKEANVCDNTDCDEFNVFKKSLRDDVNSDAIVKSYEITPVLTKYNYGTINNILNTKVTLTYNNSKKVEYYLGNINNKTIEGYDPESSEEQTVTINLKTPIGYQINETIKIKHPDNYESVWEYNKINETDIELTKFKDSNFKSQDLYVTSSIDGYNVVAIADGTKSIFYDNWEAFKNARNLYLPSTLTKLGNHALNGDTVNYLNYIKSDAEYLEVRDYAFYSSRSLMTIDANISYIGNYAFYWVDGLMSIKFSDKLTHIGDYAFLHGMYQGSSITIPSTVTEIGAGAFQNSNLKEITFLNEFEKVSDSMFYGSNFLEKVTLPSTVKEIGASAFQTCTKLKEVNLPEGLETIGNLAFASAFISGKVVIPTTVTSLGTNVFASSGIEEIEILASIKDIPINTFNDSTNLSKVILPESTKRISEKAFYNCSSLKEINLPEGLYKIGDQAFYRAFEPGSVAITIPSSVFIYGNSIFEKSGLKEVTILSDVDLSVSMFNSNAYLETVNLSNTLNVIGNYAFKGCTKLKNINIPSSLIAIGNSTFSDSFNIENNTEITLPETLESIGKSAFSGAKLKKVTILGNITVIPESAFSSCTAEEIVLPNSITEIQDSAFMYTYKLKNMNIPKSLKTIGSYGFASSFSKDANVELILPESLTSIGTYAFNKTNIVGIKILGNMTEIPEYAFYYSKYLKYVELPDSVIALNKSSFSYCSALTNIKIPKNLETIGSSAFSSSFSVDANVELVLPESLISIGSFAFDYSNLSGIKILGNITEIPNRAFNNAKYLKRVELPDSVTILNNMSFSGCSALTNIKLPKNLETIGSFVFESSFGEEGIITFDKSVQTIDNTAFNVIDKTKITFHVYSNTVPKEFAKTNEIKYVQIDPDEINVSGYKSIYKTGETVDINNLLIETIYNEKTIRKEIIKDNINIIYNNGESFSDGDTSFKLKAKNSLGYSIEKDISVTVSDRVPTFEIPTDLYGIIGKKLSTVTLPDNFYWMDDEKIITKDNYIYKAKYVPTDNENYDIVENIDVKLNLKEIIIPEFKISNKKYDGTLNVNINNIKINNLDSIYYEILSATHEKEDVGVQKVTINVRLTDEGYKKYSFENNSQESIFTSNIEVLSILVKYLSGSEEVIDKANNNHAVIKSNMFTKQGYNFLYWNTKEDGTGVTYNPKFNAYLTNDLTLYAIWAEVKFSINYCFDENCELSEMYEYADGKEVTIINNENKVEGKIFNSWNTKKDGTGKSFKANEKIIIKESYTLYPIFVDDVTYIIEKYRVIEDSHYISRIMPNTTKDKFTSNIKLGTDYSVNIETIKLEDKDLLYTGSKTSIYRGSNVYADYINIVIGDIDGDAEVTSSDLLKVRQHLIGTKILGGIYLLSADIDDDAEITSSDLLRIRQHLIGTKVIS